jgi:hypothetical protein
VKQHPILAVGLRYGLVSGVLSAVLFFTVTLFGENPLIVNKWFDGFLIPVLVFVAIREFRIYYNARGLQFWQGASVGFVVYGLTALVFALVVGAYLATAGQPWVADYVADRVALVQENQEEFSQELGEETYRQVLTEVEATDTLDLVLDDAFRKLMIGLFVTLIIATVQRRPPAQEIN